MNGRDLVRRSSTETTTGTTTGTTARRLRQVEASPIGADGRLARRSQLAAVALVLVLLGVSVFAVWSSQATSAAARNAVSANALSDDHDRAATAVAGEESLERKYRLEPGPDVRARFDPTVASLLSALAEVRQDGDASDRALVDDVLTRHRGHVRAIARLFAATDRGDIATALTVDRDEVDPSFGAIETAVLDAAKAKGRVRPDRADAAAATGEPHPAADPAGLPGCCLRPCSRGSPAGTAAS